MDDPRKSRVFDEPIEKYYVCTNPSCGSGQFAAGDYHEDDDGRPVHFKPFPGQDICHECGGEMYPK